MIKRLGYAGFGAMLAFGLTLAFFQGWAALAGILHLADGRLAYGLAYGLAFLVAYVVTGRWAVLPFAATAFYGAYAVWEWPLWQAALFVLADIGLAAGWLLSAYLAARGEAAEQEEEEAA